MEAVGLLASVAQISTSIYGLISTIQNVQLQVKHAGAHFRDRTEQLRGLQSVLDSIQSNAQLHTDIVAGYLRRIQEKVIKLHELLGKRLERLRKVSDLRFWLVFSVISAGRQIDESFAALNQDRDDLHFYMTSLIPAAMPGRSGAAAPEHSEAPTDVSLKTTRGSSARPYRV
ncbi:hypothetical protein B0J12DRAFT_683223 [Macrophomina phaseolina]|uniref:Fungal N-terminal domain-containing protein n=1 Tax=Macrophomina phaseolina TaxID=35725 RepID=A0ABQ8FV99_9PEZI|nr:hypothetical protein B0J12DRAFT_683223 [Macrophomina phaseolina]